MTEKIAFEVSENLSERKKAGIDSGQNHNKRTKHPGCSPGTCDQAASEAVSKPNKRTIFPRRRQTKPSQSLSQPSGTPSRVVKPMLEAAKTVQIYTGIISEFGLVNAAANTQGYPPEENPLIQAGTRLNRGTFPGTTPCRQRLKRLSFLCLMTGTGHQRTCTRLLLNIPEPLKKAEASLSVKRQVKKIKPLLPLSPGLSLFHHCPY